MMNQALLRQAVEKFRSHYGVAPTVAAYAPGRVEILGNHTDYNQGLVLSAAINFGHFFLAAPAPGPDCRLVAGDLMKEASFSLEDPRPVPGSKWASYVMGVAAQLRDRDPGRARPFLGLFLGNVPLGSGLSSSAALEVSTGLAISALFGIDVPPIDLARIGQAAEHKFVGVRTGLLDQISSLHGKRDALVMSDFRTPRGQERPAGRRRLLSRLQHPRQAQPGRLGLQRAARGLRARRPVLSPGVSTIRSARCAMCLPRSSPGTAAPSTM